MFYQEGDIKNGKILLSYLLGTPFELVSGYKKVKSKNWIAQKDRLEECKGSQLNVCYLKEITLKFKVYVLTNVESFLTQELSVRDCNDTIELQLINEK